jgi:hydrogenase maturation protease
MILVDATQTRHGQPGAMSRLGGGDLQPSLHSGSMHDLSLLGALDLGRRLGMSLPAEKDLTILAIEVEDVLTFGETCTPSVTRGIPRAVKAVLAELTV